jgi:hypothetical protein
MTAGDISPAVSIGTLDGELCSTAAIGVLFGDMIRRRPNGWVMKVINFGVGDVFVFTKTCCGRGDSGSDSLMAGNILKTQGLQTDAEGIS